MTQTVVMERGEEEEGEEKEVKMREKGILVICAEPRGGGFHRTSSKTFVNRLRAASSRRSNRGR